MGFLRRYLSGGECLDQVATQILALVNGVLPGSGKFNVGCFSGAAIGGNQQATVCLGWIADVIDGSL